MRRVLWSLAALAVLALPAAWAEAGHHGDRHGHHHGHFRGHGHVHSYYHGPWGHGCGAPGYSVHRYYHGGGPYWGPPSGFGYSSPRFSFFYGF